MSDELCVGDVLDTGLWTLAIVGLEPNNRVLCLVLADTIDPHAVGRLEVHAKKDFFGIDKVATL